MADDFDGLPSLMPDMERHHLGEAAVSGDDARRCGRTRLDFAGKTNNAGTQRFCKSLVARPQAKIVYRFEGENLNNPKS
jgi:hypothetical protein